MKLLHFPHFRETEKNMCVRAVACTSLISYEGKLIGVGVCMKHMIQKPLTDYTQEEYLIMKE